MNNDNKTPKTFEESVNRKKQILNILNKYNEDILLNNPTEITEEEAELLREEYDILDEQVLIEEEKEQMDTIDIDVKQTLSYIGFSLLVIIQFFLMFRDVMVYAIIEMIKIFKLDDVTRLWVFYVIVGVFALLLLFITFILFKNAKKKDNKRIILVIFIIQAIYFVINYLSFLDRYVVNIF